MDDGAGLLGGRFDIAGYLDYQEKRFVERFDANAYICMTTAMDLWDPQRDWGQKAWERIRAKVLLFGMSSDILFPAADVIDFARELREAGVDCGYLEIDSSHGHDAFLAEPVKLERLLRDFLGEPPAARQLQVAGAGAGAAELA